MIRIARPHLEACGRGSFSGWLASRVIGKSAVDTCETPCKDGLLANAGQEVVGYRTAGTRW